MNWIFVDLHCVANGHVVKLPYTYLCLYPVYWLSLGHSGSYVMCVKIDADIHEWDRVLGMIDRGSMIPTGHPGIKDLPKTWKRM